MASIPREHFTGVASSSAQDDIEKQGMEGGFVFTQPTSQGLSTVAHEGFVSCPPVSPSGSVQAEAMSVLTRRQPWFHSPVVQ